MNCKTLDPLVTPYVDGELDAANRAELDAHLRVCPPCHTRVAAEQTVRELLQTRQSVLQKEHASAALRAKCAALTRAEALVDVMGHEAVVWSIGDRTFVLIAREPRGEVERMASFVHAGLR